MPKKLIDMFPKYAARARQKRKSKYDELSGENNPLAERKKGDIIYTDRYKNFSPRFDTPNIICKARPVIKKRKRY